MRSRTCPYEASTSKSLPRYFLIVFALAGDSTMTRLSVIAYENPSTDARAVHTPLQAHKRKTADEPRTRTPSTRWTSVRCIGTGVGDKVFQPLERELLPRLARQH